MLKEFSLKRLWECEQISERAEYHVNVKCTAWDKKLCANAIDNELKSCLNILNLWSCLERLVCVCVCSRKFLLDKDVSKRTNMFGAASQNIPVTNICLIINSPAFWPTQQCKTVVCLETPWPNDCEVLSKHLKGSFGAVFPASNYRF